MNQYFTKLDVKLSLALLENFVPEWAWIPDLFVCTNLNAADIDDAFIKSALEIGGDMDLCKFEPKSFYGWHVDSIAQSSLNVTLSACDSKTLFEERKTNHIVSSIEVMDYTPLTWYAFNSQEKHCVINAGNEERLMLRIAFKFSYGKLLKWLSSSSFE